jgi:hypothetical protein
MEGGPDDYHGERAMQNPYGMMPSGMGMPANFYGQGGMGIGMGGQMGAGGMGYGGMPGARPDQGGFRSQPGAPGGRPGASAPVSNLP